MHEGLQVTLKISFTASASASTTAAAKRVSVSAASTALVFPLNTSTTLIDKQPPTPTKVAHLSGRLEEARLRRKWIQINPIKGI